MTTKRTGDIFDDNSMTLGSSAPEKDNSAAKKRPTKPKHFRKTAQEEIGKEYTNIVQTLAKNAAEGSVPHTKLLFDLGGVKEEVRASASTRRRRPRSLGQILLKEAEKLKRNQQPDTQGGNGK